MSIILVTGGNRGIGAGIIQALVTSSGDSTFLVASRSQLPDADYSSLLEGTQTEAKVEGLQLDITQDDSIRAAVADVERRFGKLDGMFRSCSWNG
jgi:NAD(P)-dependent dehydrogenase (short-subunit alcohol dehydrogenase family)